MTSSGHDEPPVDQPDPTEEPLAEPTPQPTEGDAPPQGDDAPPAQSAGPDEGLAGEASAEGVEPVEKGNIFLRLINRLPFPIVRTRKALFGLTVAILGVGFVATVAVMNSLTYMESASFCTTCHTMAPQQKAYEAGVHQDVACGECHVDPGAVGFVKAKAAGTKELIDLIMGTYPRPIEAVEHTKLPPVTHTCEKCHPLSQISKDNQPTQLVARPLFASDEKNTRSDIMVLIRPANLGTSEQKSAHWHVMQDVTFTAADRHLQTIDLVQFTDRKSGQLESYIAARQVRESTNAAADVARLKATEENRTMDCIDCHNRVGHEVPTADEAVDRALAAGTISPDLPYVKRQAMALLTNTYTSAEAAKAAIDGLDSFYKVQFPLVIQQKGAEVAAASKELNSIFSLIDTPAMKTVDGTYPNNLGHQNAPGCFRCHDGAHYLVDKGVVTNKVIPSTCDTCHTFPQMDSSTALLPVGTKPADHTDPLYVFDHRIVAGSVTPNPNTCGACHKASYCSSCHDSGAIKVNHYQMLYNHAASVQLAGGTQACAVCHQPAYCAQCHKNPVLGKSNAQLDTAG